MFNLKTALYPARFLLAVILLAVTLATPAHAFDTVAALEKADAYRQPIATARIDTQIDLYRGERLHKSRDYRVYSKPGHRSLVLFRSPRELGQKVLMVDDKFWMLMPRSRRPIRITPMQKLLGEASTGDIATMTWSDSYSATLISESDMINGIDGIETVHLSLTSHRKGTTYHQIELWLKADDFAPVVADLYVKSGKLAKQARFQIEIRDSRPMVTQMTLIDRLQKGRRTEILYRSIEEADIPDKYFNPMYLVRNNPTGY